LTAVTKANIFLNNVTYFISGYMNVKEMMDEKHPYFQEQWIPTIFYGLTPIKRKQNWAMAVIILSI